MNQYTDRTVPPYLEVQGSASGSATVTVNNQSTERKGTYFRRELSVDNSNAAVWQGITNVAVLIGAGTNGTDLVATKTGNMLVPQTPETFTYDADGNLTADGRFTHTRDAENRLLTTESLTTAPAAARVRVEWTHLSDGRWGQRIISTWDGSAYVPQATNRFVWDDKVLLAVLNGSNQPEQTYLRGSDLSGSMQAAGGVGGLLAVTLSAPSARPNPPDPSTHFVAFDGNGNVSALVSADTGTESARYEYDPFGNTLRATGPAARANSLRFSTQFADDITGRVKYLYRDYDAETGRWLSRDPIEELGFPITIKQLPNISGAKSLFNFVNNNALNLIDLWGLYEIINEGGFTASEVLAIEKKIFRACVKDFNVWVVKGGKYECCIQAKCKSGKIYLKRGKPTNAALNPTLGSAGAGVWDIGSRNKIYLYPENGSAATPWGGVAIHEFAHRCGWEHHGPGLDPSISGSNLD